MTTESEEALELAREAGIELDTDEVLEPAPIYYIEEASIIRLVRLAKQHGAEEQKRKILDCPAVTLLLEACDYGQFSADFDQPQAKPVRAAILEVCKMLRDIGAIEEQP